MWSLNYDTNEFIYATETLTEIENRLVIPKREGGQEEWIGSLGLADANYYTDNG